MSDSSDPPSRVHLSTFYTLLVEVRAAVDVMFDTLAYMECGDDEERYRAFKEALHERHESAKAEHLEAIADAMQSDDDVAGRNMGADGDWPTQSGESRS